MHTIHYPIIRLDFIDSKIVCRWIELSDTTLELVTMIAFTEEFGVVIVETFTIHDAEAKRWKIGRK